MQNNNYYRRLFSGKYALVTYKWLLGFFLVTFILSCTQLKLVDVSGDPRYQAILGVKFITKTELLAISVTSDPNYKDEISYIVLVPRPGFSGPEVVRKDTIQSGTIIKIVRVLQTSSIFVSRLIYVVDVEGVEIDKESELRINVKEESINSNFGLSYNIFERIK